MTGNQATATIDLAQLERMAHIFSGVTTFAINTGGQTQTFNTNTNCNITAAPAAGGNLTKGDVAELLDEQTHTLQEGHKKLADEAARKAVKAVQEERQQQQARDIVPMD